MDFVGDLAVLNPALVFQTFNLSSLSGELKLVVAGNAATLYFREGSLIYAFMDTRKKKIGQFLIDKGWITQDQLDEALQVWNRDKGQQRIGKILIDLGYLEYDSLVSAVHEQVREVVFEVLSWEEGLFIFYNMVYPVYEDILINERMDYLVLEGLRRLDEDE